LPARRTKRVAGVVRAVSDASRRGRSIPLPRAAGLGLLGHRLGAVVEVHLPVAPRGCRFALRAELGARRRL
jgi:hypothetical protein